MRGTRDILPGEVEAWRRIEVLARQVFERYGFHEIRTPIFEATDLFARGVGSSTDIVRKEMFTFVSGEDSLTLRPEMTASVVRAFIQHGLSRVPGAERLYYLGPMFRHERPQKGRQRQFHQIGVEVFGSDDPYVDAETIEMVMAFLAAVPAAVSGGGFGEREPAFSRLELTLVLNSVGCAVCRPAFRDALRRWLEPRASELCEDCRRRLQENPLRVFDCKVEKDRALLAHAPTALDHLCAECRQHFEAVQDHLRLLDIDFRINPRLVRGLDYYVKTAFEIIAERGLGSQNSLMGGGRYDGLVKELGGAETPGFGWALGLERLLMLLGAMQAETSPIEIRSRSDLFIAHLGEEGRARAFRLAKDLRGKGLSVRLDPRPARSLAAQLRRADREGARLALILGDDEIRSGTYQLKDMRAQTQETIETVEAGRLADDLARRIGAPGKDRTC